RRDARGRRHLPVRVAPVQPHAGPRGQLAGAGGRLRRRHGPHARLVGPRRPGAARGGPVRQRGAGPAPARPRHSPPGPRGRPAPPAAPDGPLPGPPAALLGRRAAAACSAAVVLSAGILVWAVARGPPAPPPAKRPEPLIGPPVHTVGLLRTLHGHADAVESVAVSADGKLAVSAGRDRAGPRWGRQARHGGPGLR